jgi:predicted Zn-dependent protease
MLVSCAKNPVTGQRELHLISDHKEISLGEKNYLYGQQSSGGKYVLDEQLTQYVQEIGHKLAKVSDRPELPYEFVVLNDSVPNAWALPGGKIAINRGLLIHLKTEAELAAVLGHEITHAAARHGAKSMERQLIVGTGLVAANVALGLSTKNDDPVSSIRNQAMMAGAGVTAALVTTKYSRNAELEADAYGMSYMAKAGYDPFAAVGLQETFIKLSNAQSSNWLQGLFASHPPSPERLKANKERVETLPKGLFVGEDRYKQKIAKLTHSTKAYDAYDKGLKAYEDGKFEEAEKWVDQSLLIEPKESLFHALKGDVLVKLKQPNKALDAYQTAILHNETYFYPYHQRGMLLKKMGRKEEAKRDLQISQKLLPTQSADQALLLLG